MITRVEQILTHVAQQATKLRLVVVGAENEAALETAVAAHARGMADGVLVGDRSAIVGAAERLGLDISPLELIDRASPNDCVAGALDLIHAGQVDIVVKGQVSTHVLLRGILDKKYDLRTDRSLSHTGVMDVPGEQRVMLITDAGVNVAPDLRRKRDIVLNAVEIAHALGIDRPRVAIMSFVEEVIDERIESLTEARELAAMSRDGRITGCVVEGPYSLDVALSPEAAKIKGVDSEVAGQADIIVMNDIGMGNVLYKALLLWVKPTIASVVLGAKIPLVVPSRADTPTSKLNSVALSIMVLQHRRGL